MNKWRAVGYVDDGMTEYECMACGERWLACSFGTNYCGFCGTKWEGQHQCRSHNMPRWQYDRWPDGIPWSLRDKREEQQKEFTRPRLPLAIIESRYEGGSNTFNINRKWEVDRWFRGIECVAQDMAHWLKYQREEADGDEDEYFGRKVFRARVATELERQQYGVVVPIDYLY
jgi:hypothetical protein